ncbi:MAG: MFS transporter, partial [Pseudorhodobacter sp.]|nr:MFS transporter [Pseudorhodobacter sp.]
IADARARTAEEVSQMGNLDTPTCTPVLAALIAVQGIEDVSLFVLLPWLLRVVIHLLESHRRMVLAD